MSDIEEFSYIYQNGAGVSFNSGDADSLLQALNLMIRSDRHEMGNKGKDLVKDFTWDKIALRYGDFLQKVIDNHKSQLETINFFRK